MRRKVTEQSTWKKSVASIVEACICRNFSTSYWSPARARENLQRLQPPADGGRADSVAELEQLALDPLVSPAVVLGGEPLYQRGNLGADRRPSRPVRTGPLAGDQATVLPQNGAGGNQPVHPQPCQQERDQRDEDRPVSPVEPRPQAGPPWHGDLVP